MKPWEWIAENKDVREAAIVIKNTGTFVLTDEQRQFIVLACRAFDRASLCKKCGDLSWDIPLSQYCQCDFPVLAKKESA